MNVTKSLLAAGAAALLTLSGTAAEAACRDPWITQALKEVTGRDTAYSGEDGDCRYTQYGGGSWSSYDELKAYVMVKKGGRSSVIVDPTANYSVKRITVPKSQASQISVIGGVPKFQYQGRWYTLVGADGAGLIGLDGAG